MSGSKKILLLLLIPFQLLAQEGQFTSSPNKKGTGSLVVYFSAGMARYANELGAPKYLNPTVENLHRIGTVRLMWHPDHLLKLGLETGYLTFYSYTFKDSVRNSGSVRITAVPVLAEWSMSLSKRWNVFAGSVIYLLMTKLDYLEKSSSHKLSIGWMAGGSYIMPLSENLGLGTELKWMQAAETSNGTVSLQLQLVWKFLKF
jgi:hypothetical protein